MLLHRYRQEALQIIKATKMNNFIKIFIVVIVLAFVGACINFTTDNIHSVTDIIMTSARLFLSCPMGLICILYFLCVCKRHNITKHEAIMAAIYAGIIESVFALLALISPEIKNILLNIMRNNIDNETIARSYLAEFRLFGFAKDLFDHFGYGMGILATLPLYVAINRRKVKYLLLSIPMIAATIINARTGIIIIGVIVIALLFGYIFKIIRNFNISLQAKAKQFATLFGSVAVTLSAIILAVNIVYDLNPRMRANTIADFSSVFTAFISGGESANGGVGEVLFSESFWQLPETPTGLIVGQGHSLYGSVGYSHSDVGYINDIWFFGLIGCLIIYSLLSYYAIRVTNPQNTEERMLMIGVLLSFFIFQVKGTALWSANLGALVTLFTIFLFSYYNNNKQNTRKRLS